MRGAIYNEIEPYACRWLENLIAAGHIAPGRVDARSIRELTATDVVGPGQRHFFSGIAGWSLALRLAGVPDDADVWTGSCPCQGLSVAGLQRGADDERHLWPDWFKLIAECRPAVVFGEQVAGKAGLAWLTAVRADLEGAGYAVGAACLTAASVGAPHIRERIYWGAVADSYRGGCWPERVRADGGEVGVRRVGSVLSPEAQDAGADGAVADADGRGLERARLHVRPGRQEQAEGLARGGGEDDGMADGASGRWLEWGLPRDAAEGRGAGPADGGRVGDPDGERSGRDGRSGGRAEAEGEGGRIVDGRIGDEPRAPGRASGPWDEFEWLPCRDGKTRPTGAGVRVLAHGVPARVGKLRAAGNAIVPQVAAEFIGAFLEAVADQRRAA